MKFTQHSRAGKAKKNEDRSTVAELSQTRLIAVMADGMGGLDYGDIASEIAVNTVVSFSREACEDTLNEDWFFCALKRADDAIAYECARLGTKMGCAIAIVVIDGRHLYGVSVGNIRVMVDERIVTEDEVYVDSIGGTYLTNSLRGRGIKTPLTIIQYPLPIGWCVRICSDGFYNDDEFDDASVIDIME